MSTSAPTRLSRAYYPVHDTHKLRQRPIDPVDPRQHGDDIRARVGKLLGQHARKEHAERLSHTSPVSPTPKTPSAEPGTTNLERVHVRPMAPPLDGAHGPPEQVPGLHVQVQDLRRSRLVEYGLQRGAVGAQEEELGPEAVRLFGVVALSAAVASVLGSQVFRAVRSVGLSVVMGLAAGVGDEPGRVSSAARNTQTIPLAEGNKP